MATALLLTEGENVIHSDRARLKVRARPYLGVALINGMRDSLHKVVPHASLGVTVSQLRLSLIAGLVAAGRLDQAQQGAAHEEQHQTRRRARRD